MIFFILGNENRCATIFYFYRSEIHHLSLFYLLIFWFLYTSNSGLVHSAVCGSQISLSRISFMVASLSVYWVCSNPYWKLYRSIIPHFYRVFVNIVCWELNEFIRGHFRRILVQFQNKFFTSFLDFLVNCMSYLINFEEEESRLFNEFQLGCFNSSCWVFSQQGFCWKLWSLI